MVVIIAIIIRRHPNLVRDKKGEDIVCAHRNMGVRDERTGKNVPLVYELSCQRHRSVAMYGRDNR